MKIDSYNAMDVAINRTEILKIVFEYIKNRNGMENDWKVVDHHGTLDRLTLIIQRDMNTIDVEIK